MSIRRCIRAELRRLAPSDFIVITAVCLILLVIESMAQDTGQVNRQGQQNGMSTGIAHAPVKDALSRPITAGGFVDGAPIIFSDVSHAAGLDKFHHISGTHDKSMILETPGSGVALLDYDNDGWLDIYMLNGSTIPALKGKEPPPRAMLFHNNHDGTFTDVTEKAGVGNGRWGFGVAVGDYDNDGWPDVYVSNFGRNRLYHNNHDGTFTDVAEKAGIALGGWSTGSTWGDYDHDGLLDLFVPGYVKFDPDNPPIAGKGGLPSGFCQFRGINVMCGPRGLPGEGDHLFHNNGDGTFTDMSVKAGVSDPRGYYGLASVFVDVDDDGWPDLLVANDSVPKYLYRNKHDGTFEDVSYLSGFALNDEGREQVRHQRQRARIDHRPLEDRVLEQQEGHVGERLVVGLAVDVERPTHESFRYPEHGLFQLLGQAGRERVLDDGEPERLQLGQIRLEPEIADLAVDVVQVLGGGPIPNLHGSVIAAPR